MSESFVVSADLEGLSLLQYLKLQMEISGKQIKRAIDHSGCFVNRKRERFASYKVRKGDRVEIRVDRFKQEKKLVLETLYEDEYFRAVYKPPFYVCDGSDRLHRLDKETSGILLESDYGEFFDLFRNRKIRKEYLAIVDKPIKKKLVVRNRLGVIRKEAGKKWMGVTSKGKESITYFQLLKENNGLFQVLCRPITGRTHQIRVHLASLGAPVVGDFDYGKSFCIQPPRMLLHAKSLSFIHPMTEEKMVLQAEIPEDMTRWF